MKVIVDTREKPQAIQLILSEFTRQGVEYSLQKLDTGDYFNPDNPNIVVDRKQSLNEVISNLGNRKSRFYRECQRADKDRIRLIVLVEHGGQIKSLADVEKWKNPNYGKTKLYMSGRELMERMHRVSVMYGVEWQFCNKDETGKRIIEILGGANDTRNKQ